MSTMGMSSSQKLKLISGRQGKYSLSPPNIPATKSVSLCLYVWLHMNPSTRNYY